MEIPSLVRSRLGDEDIETAVSLGDEDVVCFTPSRALLYRGEGLLSDEGVEVFSHDVERLDVSEGRRKTKFTLEYVDGTDSFTVPGKRSEAVLERLVDGVLTTAGVIEPEESIAGVFRFSELTLVVTDARLVKHVGEPVWDDDFEEYPFAEVTGLSFEEGSVATQVVLSVGGRPERIKAPNDEAPKVRETLQEALFAYHDVNSLAALNEAVGEEEGEQQESADDDIGLSEGISPLVGDSGDDDRETQATAGDTSPASGDPDPTREVDAGSRAAAGSESGSAGEPEASRSETGASAGPAPDRSSAGSRGSSASGGDGQTGAGAAEAGHDRARGAVDAEEFEALKEQVNRLTRAVKRQNEILERYQETVDQQRETIEGQSETVQQLIEELRQGR